MRRTLHVAALVAIAFATFELRAASSTVDCGMVVTQDIMLKSDLICSGTGLVVGADGITIDLNGHTIYGQTTGLGVGVHNRDGFDHVVIKNGVIDGFASGVVLQATSGNQASHNRLSRLQVRGNKQPGYGVVAQYADHLVISQSTIHHNQNAGIFLSQVTDSVLSGNLIYNNYWGILFSADVNKNVVANNRIFGHAIDELSTGIVVSESSGNSLRNNDVSDNGIGIWIESGVDNVVERNVSSYNKSAGIFVQFATQTSITLNTASRNGFAPGPRFPGVNDGINTAGTRVTVTKNRASFNADYGIEAVEATDGGRNRAQGNGNPSQCAGVECR